METSSQSKLTTSHNHDDHHPQFPTIDPLGTQPLQLLLWPLPTFYLDTQWTQWMIKLTMHNFGLFLARKFKLQTRDAQKIWTPDFTMRNHQNILIRVTYFLLIRVGGTLQICIKKVGYVKINFLDKNSLLQQRDFLYEHCVQYFKSETEAKLCLEKTMNVSHKKSCHLLFSKVENFSGFFGHWK